MPDGDVHPATQRVLDAASRKGVTLDIHVFPEGTHTASDAAAAVGAELGQIVKSLVFVAPGEDGALDPIVCLVSGPNRVDVARLAAITGEPGIRRATAREANDLTGFVIGGIPPIGHARPVRIVMDPDLGRFQTVWAAAGTATAVFPVSPGALRSLANATVAPIAEEPIVEPSVSDVDRPVAAAGDPPADGRGIRRGRDRAGRGRLSGEPQHSVVRYPGGLRARYRWGGSGSADAVFALSEAGGTLEDLGALVSDAPDLLCRAELRVEHPSGIWAVRFASPIFDGPEALLWDVPGLLVVRYGFVAYALEARTGALRWHHRSGTPLIAVLGSSRLEHVLLQSEVETFAVDQAGEVVWRAAHSDVVASAELVGGRLVLTSFDGQGRVLDPVSGRAAG